MKEGWKLIKLDELCVIERGGSPRPIDAFLTADADGINWIKISDATASGKYIYKTEQKIKPEGAKRSRIVNEGDFILSNSMSFGRPYIMKTNGCIHDGWLVLRQPKVNPDYLYLVLGSDFVYQQFDRLASGSTVRNLNIGLVKSVEIPVPSELEQQRIVAILDEAFEAIAAARANAEQNRKNARALFESYLQSVFSQRGEGWVETTIGNQVDFLAGFAFKSTQYTESKDGIRLIRGDNIVQGQLRWDGVKYLPRASAENYSQFYFEENDIVLAMDRPWVAAGLKVACITNNDLPALQVQRTARLRVKPNIHWKYLFHMIRSTKFVTYLLDGQTGLGVPHISGKQILSFEFAMPPLNQQQLIVQKLDALDDKTQRLESLYQRKIAALDELKQSLLQQAFSGQL
ncbi:restriction endonuclease subunit S [Aeromonas veronii]|uniref:restriction endonuclease subunit S n=1 Tax=Aeromonas jandaei TaxID=650 RepID=UPI000F52F2D3|nr:restriction endonuclease subunit S [Aeromonas jandaei]RQM70379.1 restriction endonuclease subunit S [Aeromonas jandaei]